jgi:hypothetical protein
MVPVLGEHDPKEVFHANEGDGGKYRRPPRDQP